MTNYETWSHCSNFDDAYSEIAELIVAEDKTTAKLYNFNLCSCLSLQAAVGPWEKRHDPGRTPWTGVLEASTGENQGSIFLGKPSAELSRKQYHLWVFDIRWCARFMFNFMKNTHLMQSNIHYMIIFSRLNVTSTTTRHFVNKHAGWYVNKIMATGKLKKLCAQACKFRSVVTSAKQPKQRSWRSLKFYRSLVLKTKTSQLIFNKIRTHDYVMYYIITCMLSYSLVILPDRRISGFPWTDQWSLILACSHLPPNLIAVSVLQSLGHRLS